MNNSYLDIKVYDTDGNLTTELREIWVDETWVFAKLTRYQIEEGKITMRIDSFIQQGTTIILQTEYVYDINEMLTHEVSRRFDINLWVNQSQVAYYYNAEGLVKEKELPVWSVDKWNSSRKMTLLYNSSGHPVQPIQLT